MRAYLFRFVSVRTQLYVCFTNAYDRVCFLFVHFYEHAQQLDVSLMCPPRLLSLDPNALECAQISAQQVAYGFFKSKCFVYP